MKRVFSFGNGAAEGAGLGKETLGGKGAGLAEMTGLTDAGIGISKVPGTNPLGEARDPGFVSGIVVRNAVEHRVR